MRRGIKGVALLLAAAALLLGLSLTSDAADHFGYALPWHLPSRVELHARTYEGGESCRARRTIEHDYGRLQQRARIFGWLTSSRRLYTLESTVGTPTVAFVEARDRDCLAGYDLLGGP
jgi:hypothetical protein